MSAPVLADKGGMQPRRLLFLAILATVAGVALSSAVVFGV